MKKSYICLCIKYILAFSINMCFCCTMPAAVKNDFINRYKAVFTSPPRFIPTMKTPDAPLAGNGDIGLTMGGTPDSLCFYIGKNDFWRAYPIYPGGISLPGGLNLCIEDLKGAEYYVEQLPGSAEIKGRFKKNKTILDLTAWVTATHNHIVIELTANEPIEISFCLWTMQGNTSTTSQGRNKVIWVTRSFENTPLLRWPTHIALALNAPGVSLSKSDKIILRPNITTSLTVIAYTNHDSPQWKERTLMESSQLTALALQKMKTEHYQWWNTFWNESSVSIDDEELERYYYMSQYLFACSSRGNKFAPGIWGPFITSDEAAWGGDYHLNYNYQAPYWAAYSSNHISLTENFDQPLLDYMEAGKRHAKELLNCRGIYYPVGIGPKGLCTAMWPLTQEEMMEKYATKDNTIDGGYKFLGQKINAVFSVGNMHMVYYSTYNRPYARKIYPYIAACADFWEDYLVQMEGRYVIQMDHFNEVMPNKRNNGIWKDRLGDFNSTLSIGLVRMLFKGAIDMSCFLQTDTGRINKWRKILECLSKYPIERNAEGRLSLRNMESGPKGVEETPSGLNRVSIHGLILPGGVMGPVTDSTFNAILLGDIDHWENKKHQSDDWGNTLNNGIETCYPGAVRVGYDAGKLLRFLKKRIALTVYPNLWIVQGGGGIETFAAVPLTINEMLLQSYEGILRVFPNWVMEKDARFDKLRAYGAFLVSSSLTDGKIEEVEIISEKGRICLIENPWRGKEVQLSRNGAITEILSGNILRITTNVGEELKLVRKKG